MKTRESYDVGTAHWTAAARAKEERRVDRLFADPFADALAGEVGRFALEASERRIGGENAYLPIRTRWFDDLVLQEAREGWHVVVLGAGFDTRAMRLLVPHSVRWFELDHEATFACKEPLLLAAGATTTTPVPAGDGLRRFASTDPEGLFARAGWSSTLLVEPWRLAYATGRLVAARRAEGAAAVGRAWFVTAGA